MTGSLGAKIGEGAFADVHAWAPGQVVKLFKPEFPRRLSWWEAQMTRAVFSAGGPAPEVIDEVKLDGRRGIVLPWLEGPTLLQLLEAGSIEIGEAGTILAELALAVQATPPPTEALPLANYMERSLELPDSVIPAHIAIAIQAWIAALPPDDRLAHCDLHPGNVIMTPEGPQLIDWLGVKRGGAALDLGCCHFLLTELVPEVLGDPAGQRALDAAVQSEYARLSGMPPAALAKAVRDHQPIIYVLFLLGATPRPGTRERLLQRIEEELSRPPVLS